VIKSESSIAIVTGNNQGIATYYEVDFNQTYTLDEEFFEEKYSVEK
jgi:hypothetical protein